MFNPDGTLPIRPCAYYDNQTKLKLLCHHNARYLVPTVELIEFLKPYVDESTIEIGAGCGDLGRSLGIKMTDSYVQWEPEVISYYERLGQPIIQYGADVEKIDAISAIKKYNPKTVIGGWVTQWVDPDKPVTRPGSMYGIKETELLEMVDTYILIGAEHIHMHKYIMEIPHETIDAPFVRSRRKDNKIWIWRRRR